jgi:hypothetical protein
MKLTRPRVPAEVLSGLSGRDRAVTKAGPNRTERSRPEIREEHDATPVALGAGPIGRRRPLLAAPSETASVCAERYVTT